MLVLLPFGYLPFEHHLISPVIKMSTDRTQNFLYIFLYSIYDPDCVVVSIVKIQRCPYYLFRKINNLTLFMSSS